MKAFKILLYILTIISLPLMIQSQLAKSENESNIIINLHILQNVRNQVEYQGHIEIIYKGETGSRILLRKLEMTTDNKVMEEKRITRELQGIGNEMAEYEIVRNVIENVSVSRVASQQELSSAQNAFSRMQELYPIILRGMHREEVTIDLKEIFGDEFYEGNQKTINIIIQYEQNGQRKEASKSATITRVPDWGSLGPEWYLGDLHLHTNYTDCEPTVEVGEFPIIIPNAPGWATVEKRWQEADALGLSWFSVTDHNYCLDNDDWKKMKKEIDTLMNAKRYFAVLQSAEISTADDCYCFEGDNEELCRLFNSTNCSTNAAHLGVHNIPYLIDSTHNPDLCRHPQWCPDSPTLQYAIDVANYYYNDSFSIIYHPINIDILPTKWFWDCESIQNCNTCGNKQICGYSGIEVWNNSQTGSSPHLGSIDLWKEKLKAGEHVYIYAGSDTESGEYLDGGFNGVYAPYLFYYPEIETRKKKLVDALKKGHLYISNHPGLFIEVNSNKGATGMMGDTIVVDPTDKIKVHVKVASKYPGTLKIFKGMDGDEKEWKSININVENFDKTWGDTLKATNTYYRAEFISKHQIEITFQAYTNPVWLLAIKKFYFGIEIRNDEDSPSIYDDKIVFRNWKYGKSDIGYYWAGGDGEFGTWDETGVKYITKDSYSQDMPVVHKNIILWADKRNVSQIHPYPDIYMYDMGEDEILGTSDDKGEFLIPTDHYVGGRIDVYGNTIVWANIRLENDGRYYYSIKGYDIPTNSVFDISQKSTDEKNNPAIHGNIVVWEEFSEDNLYDIQAYDLFYEKQFSITAMPGNQRYPAIFDHIVVWQDDRNGNSDIYGYDLGVDGIFGTRDDKGETAITRNACNQYLPAIHHNIIVWHDKRLQSGSAIYGFDVGLDGILGSFDDKEMGEFQITPGGSISGTPDIYENIVVWTEKRKGWDNVVGAYLYFMGPPRIPSDPDLFVPRNDDIVPYPFTSLNFDWPNSMGTPPHTFRFQLSNDINFKSLIYDVYPLEESEFTCTGLLLPSITYYWRVISSNIYGYSPWSKTWSFSTSECIEPESPKNQSPFPRFLETNICPYPSVTFDWKDYVNMVPVTYEIQLSTDPKFSNSVFYESGLSISDYTYVGRLNPLTKYYWRVRASNRCSSSSWSDVWSFTTGTCMGSSIEFRVTTNPSKQINPVIYGDYATWLDNRDDYYYVYVCRLPCDEQTERAVFPNLNNQQNQDIYGRNIVWENCPDPRCQIHGYDMGSDSMFGTSDDSGLFQITGNTNSPKNPAIYKNIVVWSDTVSEKSDIYGYDMGLDGVFGSRDDRWKFKITNSGTCLYPKIYNSIVVWQDSRNGYSNIYGYDLGPDGAFGTGDDRGEFRISNNPFSQQIPDIYGNIVVWHDTRNKNSGRYFDIYGYDMGQDGIFGTSDDKGEFRLPTDNYCGGFIDIFENVIVWSCGKVYGFNLGSDKTYGISDDGGEFIVSSIYHRIPTSPRIYGDKVVWVDDRNDDGTLKNFDIYGAHLVILSNQGPGISNVDASPNPTYCASNVALTATINNNGSYFNIAGAEYFIDIAGTDGTGVSMSASDGSFDSLTENAIVTIDISSLSTGIHTIYVHGKDELGNWGKTQVINLDVINDCLGPLTEGISVIPNPTNCDDAIILTAMVNDTSTGGSNISAAEYFVDVVGIEGTGIGMSPYDGSFDFEKETVIAILNVEGWASGEHTLYIHGRDAIGNWGGFQSYAFSVTCQRPSSQISNQMTSVAQSHIIQASDLLNQVNDLLSKAEGKDTGDVEKIINEAKELLNLAKVTLATNPIASNNYALKAIEKLKQAIAMLKTLLGYPFII